MMTINEYQQEAKRTLRDNGNYELNCSNVCMGLSGECGELVDIYKKFIYQGKELDKNHVIEEIGDVLWYVANICNVNDISMEQCMQKNAEKLRIRYPNGFSIKDANERRDKLCQN